eukprot:scaffold2962_cov169-Amphora_coffeaeformis.AAC.4
MNDNTIAAMKDTRQGESSIDCLAMEETRRPETMDVEGEKGLKPQHNNSPMMMMMTPREEHAHMRLRRGRDEQLPEETSDAFADRLSCSLANISYAPGHNHHSHHHNSNTNLFPRPRRSKPSAAATAVGGVLEAWDGGEASVESSAESFTNGDGSSDARQVTASATTTNNTTTSSGEERESSLSGAPMEEQACRNCTSSSEEREFTTLHTAKTAPLELVHKNSNNRSSSETRSGGPTRFGHVHRLHHHTTSHGHILHHAQPHLPTVNRPKATTSSADDFGLPVPIDDHVSGQGTGGAKHATVVAHLPPPSADSFSSSASGGEGERGAEEHKDSLLEPYSEPGYHMIRLTFNRLSRTQKAVKSAETDSSGDTQEAKYKKPAAKRALTGISVIEGPKKKKKKPERGGDSGSDDGTGTNGSSSGSGTEGGYAGSASSNDNRGVGSLAYSSPSISSLEESMSKRKRSKSGNQQSGLPTPHRPLIGKKTESGSVSSEIADFSSGASETEVAKTMRDLREESSSITSSSNEDSDEQDLSDAFINKSKRRKAESPPRSLQLPTGEKIPIMDSTQRACRKIDDTTVTELALGGKPPLLAVGPDVIAHVLTFLEPPEILDVLTAPLSKDWLDTFCKQQELWRVLCIVEPFKAQVGEVSEMESDESIDSFPMNVEAELRLRFGKFRMMYTSFVRCMKYLGRIKDDALNGRAPSVIDYGAADATAARSIGGNQSLQSFLARARGFVIRNRTDTERAAADSLTDSSSSDDDNNNNEGNGVARMARIQPIGVLDDGSSSASDQKRKRRRRKKEAGDRREVRYASSCITRRLLLPAATGEMGNTDLPWSCAIYSIVNWMVGFSSVEGIQTMCLKVLPFLLEDEQQRMTAQRAGLTDVVLRGMVMFPKSVPLHTAAFHTIVLLARPLGGREGMLFHSSMVNASGIFSGGNAGGTNGKSGIAVMLDSMRRFESEAVLQAMSCWSLVNIALAPAQKEVLVKLGGIQATAGAMLAHPENAEVQFRALFALINLVIPSVAMTNNVDTQDTAIEDEQGNDMLDELVEQIVGLVVRAMKNYCSSKAILNRACLVLHNLSLTPGYHQHLLLIPHCYQMLEWCLANYRTDQVLQQSATGTLHRLQATLGSNDSLRARFTASLQAQHRVSLQQAHQEAMLLRQMESSLASASRS